SVDVHGTGSPLYWARRSTSAATAPEHARNSTFETREPSASSKPPSAATFGPQASGDRRHSFSPLTLVPAKNVSAPSPELYESPSTTTTSSPLCGSTVGVTGTSDDADTNSVATQTSSTTSTRALEAMATTSAASATTMTTA